jgi:hypothetical protein
MKVTAHPQGLNKKLKADENEIFDGGQIPSLLVCYDSKFLQTRSATSPCGRKFAMVVRLQCTDVWSRSSLVGPILSAFDATHNAPRT